MAAVPAAASSLAASGGAGASLPDGAAGAAVPSTLLFALAAAVLGGLILNLMPCVFPVIGLKVLSFARAAGDEPRRARRHAFVFSAGVVTAFVALGIVLMAVRSVGDLVGWGFQMQSPLFVSAMTLLFVLLGLNLAGVFEAGVGLTRVAVPGAGGAGVSARPESLSGSYGTGVVAVVVATPCTAPFMGGAVGYTLTSPPLHTLLIFAALGIGMAVPYLLLGSSTAVLRLLPRPGPWLQTFRQLLAFPMFATAAWLAWVLTLQTGADGLLQLLIAAILVALVAWIYGHRQMSGKPLMSGPGLAWAAMALVATVAGLWLLTRIEAIDIQTSAGTGATTIESARPNRATASTGLAVARNDGWEAWSTERVAQATADGKTVFVDFTAAWCISCQANKKLVLERDAVSRSLRSDRVVLLRADWTRRDPAITAELARHGRNGVPLYLVYAPGAAQPRILPELLTAGVVLSALGLTD